jgi:hypothetical protein
MYWRSLMVNSRNKIDQGAMLTTYHKIWGEKHDLLNSAEGQDLTAQMSLWFSLSKWSTSCTTVYLLFSCILAMTMKISELTDADDQWNQYVQLLLENSCGRKRVQQDLQEQSWYYRILIQWLIDCSP